MIACDLVAALMALLWLKPLAARTVEEAEGGLGSPGRLTAAGARTAA
jgi:hypothetical protein